MDEYTINIAILGKHVHRIVLPAGLTMEQARNAAIDTATRYPAASGFVVTLIRSQTIMRDVPFLAPG
jgi:hypothetical protein